MKRLTSFVMVMAIFFSTTVNAATNNTANVAPIIKQHHALLKASNENSISTTVFTSKIANTGAIATARVTSVQNGTDFQDFFELFLTTEDANPSINYYISQSFPNAPYQDYESISIYSDQNCTNSYMRWWGEQIGHRHDGQISAEYPLAFASIIGLKQATTYYLTTEINLAYNFQDEFLIQYRFIVYITDLGIILHFPDDGEGDGIDQQGWPVWIETWDLRPNLHPYQITICNDDGPIGPDNPPVIDSMLFAIAMTEEKAGFWAGIADVQFYQDDSINSFYQTNTVELDSGGVSVDTSTGFTFNSPGMHSIKVLVNPSGTINETDSTDNEIVIYFNVVSMSDTPAVAIDNIQHTNWRDVLITWCGSDVNGDILEYRYKLDSEAWSSWDMLTSMSYANLSSGQHIFYVEVRDPGELINADNQTFNIDQPVELADISDTTIAYGQTLEFDLLVTGGSEAYNYSAVYGTIDTSGYSWTPFYNPNPYSEIITVSCATWPINYDSDGFAIVITLSNVVISGLEANYGALEGDILFDSSIVASGGDNSSYSWTLTANTVKGDWLALTSLNGSLTGLTGTAPYVDNEIIYDFTLSCASQTQNTAQNFTVTVNSMDVVVETEYDTVRTILNKAIDPFTATVHGLEQGQCVWSIGVPPTSNDGNSSWNGLKIAVGVHDTIITITGTPTTTIDLPIYAAKYNAWQIQNVAWVMINAFPAVSFTVEPSYNFLQNHSAQIQLSAKGGDSSNYTWTMSDNDLLSVDSTLGNLVWIAVNTNDIGTWQVDVSCSQSNLPANSHSEQINFSVGQSLWSIQPMEMKFPTTQTTLQLVLNNTSVDGSTLAYALTLSNWTSYNIVSPLSGSLPAGESATVQIVSHENNTPYELTTQLKVDINNGAYLPVVNITTAASNTSLQAFSFSRGTDPAQSLTIWNTTSTEQSVELTEIGGIFNVSTNQVTIAAGNFSIIYINAQGSVETVYDTLVLTSADINTQISLRKQSAINNTVLYSYDDGMADNQIQYGGYLVNSFNIESGYQLMGMEVFLPINNQLFNWVILDNNLNQIYSEEYQSNYSGWQQLMLAPDNYYNAGTYYLGVMSTPNEPELIVGMDNTSTGVSWSDSSGSFEQLNAMLFIRAISSTMVNIADNEDIPLQFSLGQNYPNPFNPTTTITYSLPSKTDVQLTIYSLTGQVVATLVNKKQNLGNHVLRVDMSSYGLSSGIYFYQLITPEFQAVKKLMFIK